FAVGTILCVVLMAVFMPVLVNDYQQQLKDYNTNVAANEAELRKVHVYKNITPTVYRPPNVLSVFNTGLDKQLDNSEKINIQGLSDTKMETGQTNPLLSVFPTLDVTLIFKIVISILALLMAYDVISGERELGTLKLILSSTTARYQVLLGKVTAGLMTLVVPVTVSFIVGLLILMLSDMVSLTGTEWFRIGLMYFACLIFVSALFNLGLLFSCLSKNSAICLVCSMFLWLFFAAIIPNASAYIASQLKPVESAKEFSGKVKAITQQRDNEINELTKDIKGGGSQSDAPDAFGRMYVMLCNKSFMDYHQKRYPITESVKMKYFNKAFELEKERTNELLRQKNFGQNIASSSPTVLFESLMSVLAGTDFGNYECFKNSVKTYVNEVANHIRSETENFTLTSYFTPCKEGDQEKLINLYYKPYMEAKDKTDKAEAMKKVMEVYEKLMKETPSLGLQNFPKFTYRSQSITESLRQAIPSMAVLIFMSVLFFTLSFVMFLKYDAR
ncbi:ABC transporter permease, partial [Planctomycetota bacterium]